MHGDERYLIVVNLSDRPAHGRIHVPWGDVAGASWKWIDLLSGAFYEQDGDELQSRGLYVSLGRWRYHLFQCLRTNKKSRSHLIETLAIRVSRLSM